MPLTVYRNRWAEPTPRKPVTARSRRWVGWWLFWHLPLAAACASADDLAEAAVQAFDAHADAEIVTGCPGLGPLGGARVLAEVGDDRARFADAGAASDNIRPVVG